jgi:hypothetical protein
MTTIAETADIVPLINVFSVDPPNQQELVEPLVGATDTSVRDLPGFILAALHRSIDGTKVTMYSQWKTAEHYRHYQPMQSCPAAPPYAARAMAIAQFEPGMYEMVKVFDW